MDARPQPFELTAGALCLDFANTLEDHTDGATEHLRSYDDLLAFCVQSGCLAAAEAAARRRAVGHEAARSAWASAAELRDRLYRIFAARAAGRPTPATDLDRLNTDLAAALGDLRLVPGEPAFSWTWRDDPSPTAPLRPILRSAAELLTSPDLERVRECAGATCTWLFLDASRNRSRRWCSMETCGNRAKARRHYRRRRATG